LNITHTLCQYAFDFHLFAILLDKRHVHVQVMVGDGMQDPLLRLNGVNENLRIRIETELRGADSPEKVEQAVLAIFPEFPRGNTSEEPSLGKAILETWSAEQVSLETYLKLLHDYRILDTALDAMTVHFDGQKTQFHLLRQAAIAGKVAFPLPNEQPLGGVITITLEGEHLGDWLEAATWHKGRDIAPRSIKDDNAMGEDGEAATWL
tara:strand:+ start:529 stop:1149 length:621 start_codon:yes stop_codon:yes gene_type:complete